MAKEFLKNLFESKQDYLRNSLQDLQLPKDALKIERAVSEYLNKLWRRGNSPWITPCY